MNDQKPIIVMFIGYAGSGKTYFATRLARELSAVTLNTDALRLSMFGSLDRIEQIRETDRPRLYDDVFGAMNYAAKQILQSGVSVVYDAQMTKRQDRIVIEQLAAESNALAVLVWIKTSKETAYRRGQEREVRDDSQQYSAERIRKIVDWSESVTELPEHGENFVEISGEISFEEQLQTFRLNQL
jgi:uncharacterized protein